MPRHMPCESNSAPARRLAHRLVCAAVLAMVAGCALVLPSPTAAQSGQTTGEDGQAALLAGFTAAWNAADVDAVMRYFTPDASVSTASGWGYYSGATQIRAWVTDRAHSGELVAGLVDDASGERVTWRLSASTATERKLALPPVESVASVLLRDGRIATLDLRYDPDSRQRYVVRLDAISAAWKPPAATGIAPPPQPGARSPFTGQAVAAWTAALGACVLVAVASTAPARGRRPGAIATNTHITDAAHEEK